MRRVVSIFVQFPIRCSQFEDLFSNVLFNYQWLYAKMSACPLQAVLSDFEDACNHVTDKDARCSASHKYLVNHRDCSYHL